MSKNNFKFIKIKPDYTNFLLQYDNKVSYNKIILKKENRPFLGILFNINNKNYYAPLSSKKNKFFKLHKKYKKTKKNNVDMFFIEDKNSDLLEKGIEFCNNSKNKKQIKEQAIKGYNIVKNHTNKRIENRYCNFRLLEEKCKEYEEKLLLKK